MLFVLSTFLQIGFAFKLSQTAWPESHQYSCKCYLTVLLKLNKSSMLLSAWLKKEMHCVRGEEHTFIL